MKKLKIYHLLILLLIFGCSSDDDSNNNTQNIAEDIVGIWNLTGYSSNSNTIETGRIVTESLSSSDYSLEFTDNPKEINVNGTLEVLVEETNNGNTSDFTYLVNGNFDEGFHTGEWRIENGNLITRSFENDPNEEGAFDLITEIVELTSNSLILKIDNAQYSSENSTQTGIRTLTYSKQ
ncbi:MAG TPA: hypothetical protein PLL09_14060 [Flavobacterium sp.]|uniref:hypothetical protein n=1 Tax=unclassified Flavobacterium TaxID=196869 RepID=UPI0025BF016D|nr:MULTISPECIES: hypothetical protein [unclassified Flavobacterium]HRE78938.1 hypothetical protein [Flavobacterium sp.]